MPIDEDEKDDIIFVQLDDCKHLFEVNFLDQWFDTKVAGMKGNDEMKIQLLQCLLCQTPVRSTQRYGAISKQALIDVQLVKVKEQGDPVQLNDQRRALKVNMQLISIKGGLHRHALKASLVVVDLIEKPHLDRNRLASLENVIRFMSQMIEFQREDLRKLDEIVYRRDDRERMPLFGQVAADTRGPRGAVATRFIEQFYGKKNPTTDGQWGSIELLRVIDKELNFLFDWISTNAKSCNQQMVEEFGYEWRRLVIFVQLMEVLIKATDKGKEIDHEGWAQLEEVMKIINGEDAFVEDIEKRAKDMIDSLVKMSGLNTGLGITKKEKIEIMRAMDLARGHWYKCPNGHIYCIGDCGGATVEAKCPECNAIIGGGSHRLRADNSVATEMDGATRSAYEDNVLGDHEFARRMQEAWNGNML